MEYPLDIYWSGNWKVVQNLVSGTVLVYIDRYHWCDYLVYRFLVLDFSFDSKNFFFGSNVNYLVKKVRSLFNCSDQDYLSIFVPYDVEYYNFFDRMFFVVEVVWPVFYNKTEKFYFSVHCFINDGYCSILIVLDLVNVFFKHILLDYWVNYSNKVVYFYSISFYLFEFSNNSNGCFFDHNEDSKISLEVHPYLNFHDVSVKYSTDYSG